MKKKWRIALICVLCAACLAGIGVWAAGNYGSEDDPLVAMSYLEDVLGPELREDFSEALEAVDGAADGEFDGVTLSGASLSLETGAEILCLEPGAATSGTLVDVTAGGIVNPGETLEANHLYIAADDDTVIAGLGEALVRGGYEIS